jgi:glycyl-tRNA synthetase
VSGFQTYGINGMKMKNKLIDYWRKIMVKGNIHEIETPTLTPHSVLKASGHVDRFTDYVIETDDKTIRADHFVKDYMKSKNYDSSIVDSWTADQLENYVNKNKLFEKEIKVTTKNLMHQTVDGNYLRPEIAQSIFTDFRQFYDYFDQKLPFGISQTGKSYRKEISPEQFTRMREFVQMETEYFFDPRDTSHSNYNNIKHLHVPLLTQNLQLNVLPPVADISLQFAVDNKLICNEIMAYFIGSIYLYAKTIGIDMNKIRFRQHLSTEMAHYAIECWDLECFVNDSWLECVGCAYRGDYDLIAHNNSDCNRVKTSEFTMIKVLRPDIKKIKKSFTDVTLLSAVSRLTEDDHTKLLNNETIDVNGHKLDLDYFIVLEEKKWYTYIPHVIEPSFGLERILYVLLAHNFKIRKNSTRSVLTLPSNMAPYDVAIFALSNKDSLTPFVSSLENELSRNGLRCLVDNSSVGIGKKYVRSDELGIYNAITIDFDTINDNSVTIRKRDSMEQVRINIDNLKENINKYIN